MKIRTFLNNLDYFKFKDFSLKTRRQSVENIEKKYQDKLDQLEKEVEKHKGIEKQLSQHSEQTSQNKNVLEILFHFEKTYRLIFGAQLTLMTFIENDLNKKVPQSVLEAVYRRTPLSYNPNLGFSFSMP